MDSRAFELPDPERATQAQLLAHAAWVRRLARSLVSDATSADDVVQETWLAALQHPPASNRPVRPWLSRVVANMAHNHRRSERRRADHEITERAVHEPPTPDETAQWIETQRMLLDEVDRLPEPLRSTLARHYFQDVSFAEIARQDGIGASTVHGRVKQALDALRQRLDERHRGQRGAWMALVAPLAGVSEPTTTSTGSTSAAGAAAGATAGTLIAMNTLVKLGIAAAFVVAGFGVWNITRPRPVDPLEVVLRTPPAASDLQGDRDASRTGDKRDERVAVAGATLEPAALPFAATSDLEALVEARVVDERGVPIAGARLTCVDRTELREIALEDAPSATSDDQGRVRLALRSTDASKRRGREADMPKDEWPAILEIGAAGHTRVSLDRHVKAGTTTALGDIVLTDAGDVVGRVVDHEGHAIADADVQLVLPELTFEDLDASGRYMEGNKPRRAYAQSAADGSYAMRGVQPGVYRTWALKTSLVATFTDTLELHAGEELRVPDIVMKVNANAVRGIVVDEDGTPCKRVEIRSTAAGREQWLGENSSKDGNFVIEDTAAAMLDVYAFTWDEAQGDAIARNVPAGTNDLMLRIGKPHWIDLVVRDPEQRPIPSAEIGVYDKNGGGQSGSSGEHPDGRYRFKAIAKPFLLVVQAPGFEKVELGPFDAAAMPNELSVTLKTVARVTGHVTAEGQPVKGAYACLTRVADTDTPRNRNGFPTRFEMKGDRYEQTREDGSFAFDCCEAGRFVVHVQVPGFALFESNDLDLGPDRGAALEIALTSGGTLEGRLLTSAGDTPAGSWVTASRGMGRDASAAVDAHGHYRIEHLSAGTWWVRRTSQDMRSRSSTVATAPSDPTLRQVEIVEGQTTTFDVDARDAPPVVLVGRCAIAGVDMRTWTASYIPPGEDRWSRKGEPVAADGSFRIALPDVGRVALSLVAAGTDRRDGHVDIELDLRPGENRWTLDVPTGTLTVDGPALARGPLAHVRPLENGATFTTRFRSPSGAPLVLSNLPAGPARIVDAKSGALLVEVDVPSGGEMRVTLR